jgi:hypothetical protein
MGNLLNYAGPATADTWRDMRREFQTVLARIQRGIAEAQGRIARIEARHANTLAAARKKSPRGHVSAELETQIRENFDVERRAVENHLSAERKRERDYLDAITELSRRIAASSPFEAA